MESSTAVPRPRTGHRLVDARRPDRPRRRAAWRQSGGPATSATATGTTSATPSWRPSSPRSAAACSTWASPPAIASRSCAPPVPSGRTRTSASRARAPWSSRSTRPTPPRSASGSRATPSRGRSSARTPRRSRRSAPCATGCPRWRRSSSSTPSGDVGDAIPLDALRERGRAHDPAELDERTRAVSRDDPYTIIYTSGTTGPPKGCVLSHGNYRDVVSMCERDAHRPGRRHRLPVPPARPLLRAADPALRARHRRDDRLLRGRPEADRPRALRGAARPTSRRSRASSRSSTRSSPPTATSTRSAAPPSSGSRCARCRRRARTSRAELQAHFDGAEEKLFKNVRARVRRQPAPGHVGRGADRAGDPRVLLRLRRAGARGLRDDRDGDRGDGLDRRLLPLRLGRPRAARAWRSGSPTTARCCSRARTSSAATTRTPTRRSARSTTAGCTRATSGASTRTASSSSPAARRTSSSPRAART